MIIYNDDIQLMTMINNCDVVERDRGISGNEIYIQYTDSLIDSLSVFGNAATSPISRVPRCITKRRTR